MTQITEGKPADPVSSFPSEQSSAVVPFPGAHLSLWQRYFCKPLSRDAEKVYNADNRRFSLFSKGFIICFLLSMVVLSAILIPVLVIFRPRHHPTHYDHQHPGTNPGPITNPGVPFNQSEAGPINSAITINFPDPYLLLQNGTWYAFATNNAVGLLNPAANASTQFYSDNVQIASSQNLVNWTILNSVDNLLPTVGAWAVQAGVAKAPFNTGPGVWAPAVFQRPSDNKWVLYYSAKARTAQIQHCIGASVSTTDSFLGPYEPVETSFACPTSQGGAIDPTSFIDDDGSVYIAYKVDGNNKGNGGACGNTVEPIHSTPIMLQKVEADGVTPVDKAVTILDRISADGPLVEAPTLVKVSGTYFLFFSSGCTRDPSYTVKYAWSSTLQGPYTRASHDLLQSGNWSLSAPGSCSVAQDQSGKWAIAFHARVATADGGAREMFTAGLNFNGTEVTIVDYATEK